MRLTRRYRFSASHRLDVPAFTPEVNRQVFGKCNNPFGHGHNYILEITVEGAPDPAGHVVNREALDRLVTGQVLALLDHKDLNRDIPEFAQTVPTTENLTSLIEGKLREHWVLAPRLARIRIRETDRNTFELETAS